MLGVRFFIAAALVISGVVATCPGYAQTGYETDCSTGVSDGTVCNATCAPSYTGTPAGTVMCNGTDGSYSDVFSGCSLTTTSSNMTGSNATNATSNMTTSAVGGSATSDCIGTTCSTNSAVTCSICNPNRREGSDSLATLRSVDEDVSSRRQTCTGAGCFYQVAVVCPDCSSNGTDAAVLSCCESCRSAIASGTGFYTNLDYTTRQQLVDRFVCALPNGTEVAQPGGTMTVVDANGQAIVPVAPGAAFVVGPCLSSCDATAECPAGMVCSCRLCDSSRSGRSSRQQLMQLVISSAAYCPSAACCWDFYKSVPCTYRASCSCPATGEYARECPQCEDSSKKGLLGLLGLLAIIPLVCLLLLSVLCCCMMRPQRRGKRFPLASFVPAPLMPLPPGMAPMPPPMAPSLVPSCTAGTLPPHAVSVVSAHGGMF
eukprot:TRINITY_DN362_c1_g1_i1.p1 TRINITY_DN362_c1_g1~~TRINITY_DN362_c1_g1_i1.p1  ORF type:complete len:429 (+),score=46.52 TRINITY_DN362_c1_g1_i1:288-1574(+)